MNKNYIVVVFLSGGRILDRAVCQNHDLEACIASHAEGLRRAGVAGGTAKVRRGYESERAANLAAFGSEEGYQGGNLSEHARNCGRCGGNGMGQYKHIAAGCCFECGAPPAPLFFSFTPMSVN